MCQRYQRTCDERIADMTAAHADQIHELQEALSKCDVRIRELEDALERNGIDPSFVFSVSLSPSVSVCEHDDGFFFLRVISLPSYVLAVCHSASLCRSVSLSVRWHSLLLASALLATLSVTLRRCCVLCTLLLSTFPSVAFTCPCRLLLCAPLCRCGFFAATLCWRRH